MKYIIRVNRRIRYMKVYNITKKIGERQNALTKLLLKLFNPSKPEKGAV